MAEFHHCIQTFLFKTFIRICSNIGLLYFTLTSNTLYLSNSWYLLLFYRPLVTQLFVACAPYGVEPVRQHALAVRDRLAHEFPKLFAPGILFNPKNGDDGWSNGAKDKDILMDNVFAAIETRFTEKKKNLKKRKFLKKDKILKIETF